MTTSGAVSYTNLDVYKRQVYKYEGYNYISKLLIHWLLYTMITKVANKKKQNFSFVL